MRSTQQISKKQQKKTIMTILGIDNKP